MMTTSDPDGRRRAAIAFAAAFVVAIVLLVPWEPRSFGGETDLSWQLVLHDAYATGAHFGEQIVFTYGPYGFAWCGYDPRTFAAGLAVWLLIAVAFAAGTLEIARDAIRSPVLAAFFVMAMAAITTMQFGALDVANNVQFVVLSVILVRLHAVRPGGWAEYLVVVALAVAALVKFSFFTAAAGVIVVLTITDLLRRRLPVMAITFAGALTLFWIAARQPLANVPRFIRTSIELGSGYSEAMALRFPFVSDQFEIAVFLVLVAALLFRMARSWPEALALLPLFFVVFRMGFTRQDGHDIDAVAVLALAVYINLPERLARGGIRERVAWGVLAAAATGLFSMALTSRALPDLPLQVARAVRTQIGQLADLVAHGTDRLDRQRAETMARYRAFLQRRPEGSSFDVYPSASGALIARQLPAARRPVFQSATAYTERLLEMNAAHLRGPGAPSTILFDVVPLDFRFPTLEDSASWREILRRYEPVGRNGQFEVLRRRATPLDFPVRERRTIHVRFDEPFAVPDPGGDLLFARVDLRYTTAGRLMRAVYITPPLFARVLVPGEKPWRFRIVPANVRVGFLMSPLVRKVDDFALVTGDGRTRLPRVSSMAFGRPQYPWMFEPEIAVSFERVSYQ
jgi:hypothetical protein